MFLGATVMVLGMALLAFALTYGFPFENELTNWAISRGAVIVALAALLFLLQLAWVGEEGAVRVQTITLSLLAALLVARFTQDRLEDVLDKTPLGRRRQRRGP